MSIRIARRLSAVAILACCAAAFAQPRVVTLRASAYVNPAGELVPDAVVVIRDGRIVQVGGQPPSGSTVVDFGDGVICPGLIDVDASLGALRTVNGTLVSQLRETVSAFQPNADARDSLDRFHPQLSAALRAGITTFALSPDDEDLVGGRIAVCRTYAPAASSSAGPLKLSLSSDVLEADRDPTSHGGAVALLREHLDNAAASGELDNPFVQFAQGKLAGVLTAPSAASVFAVLDFIEQHKLRLALVHETDAREVAPLLAGRNIPVIIGPYDFSSDERDASAGRIFEHAGVELAIAGGLPAQPADSLRVSAAIAVRNGLSPAAARRAITIAPAHVLGVLEDVGSIENGRRADLVVFTRDPLDLRARVAAVFADGQRVRDAGEATD